MRVMVIPIVVGPQRFRKKDKMNWNSERESRSYRQIIDMIG